MRIIVAVLIVFAVAAGGHATGTPSASHPAPAAPTMPTAGAHLSTQCQADWVCGTCPNGDWWGYLNDDSPDAVWTQRSNLFFSTEKPCG